MAMTASLRKFALTSHVASSVGWFGAVAAFLALALAGVTSHDVQLVRAAYLAMHLVTWFVIVPASLAAFVTGLVQSLGTSWGLFRHYWIVAKLALTTIATILLLVHTQPIDRVASLAATAALTAGDLWQVRLQLVGDASAALFVLFGTTLLSVYKPWGLTTYGLQYETGAASRSRTAASQRSRPAGHFVVVGIMAFVVVILVLHLLGGALHAH